MSSDQLPGVPCEVSEGVFVVSSGPGTLGTSNAVVVVRDREAVVVDTFLLPGMAQHLKGLVGALKVTVRAVVNTHPHVDHVGGNIVFGDETPVVAAADTVHSVRRLAVDTSFLPARFPSHADGLQDLRLRVPAPLEQTEQELLPGVFVKEVGPAHSPSDVVVTVPSDGVVIAGDVSFAGVTPMALPGHADLRGWVRVLETLMRLDPAMVVSGHGMQWDSGSLSATRSWVQQVLLTVDQCWQDTADRALSGSELLDVALAQFAPPPRTESWLEPGRARLALAVAVADVTGDVSVLDPRIPRATRTDS